MQPIDAAEVVFDQPQKKQGWQTIDPSEVIFDQLQGKRGFKAIDPSKVIFDQPLPSPITGAMTRQQMQGLAPPATQQDLETAVMAGTPEAAIAKQPLIKAETLTELGGAAKDMVFGGPRSVMIPEERYQQVAKEAGYYKPTGEWSSATGETKVWEPTPVDVHPGWSKPWEMIGSQIGAGAKMSAGGLVDLYEKLTGPPATDIQKGWMDSIKKMFTVPPEKVGTDLASKVLQGLGSAPIGVAEFGGAMAVGGLPGAMALGALKAPGGVVEKAKGAAEYGLLGGALRATGGLSLAPRVGAMGAIGGGQAALAGGDAKDITAGALVMMVLATPGGRKLKEAVDTDTKPADMGKVEWENVKEAVGRAPEPEAPKAEPIPTPEPPLKAPEPAVAAREPEVGVTPPEAPVRGVEVKVNAQGYADTPYTRIFGFSERGGSVLGDMVHNLPAGKRERGIELLTKELGSREKAERFVELFRKGDGVTAEREFPEYSGKGLEMLAERKAKVQGGIKFRDISEPPPRPAEAPAKAAKEPWEMTREEYRPFWRDKTKQLYQDKIASWSHGDTGPGMARYEESVRGLAMNKADLAKLERGEILTDDVLDRDHKVKVRKALSENKPVPPEVLADYPDLAAKGKGKVGVEIPKGKYGDRIGDIAKTYTMPDGTVFRNYPERKVKNVVIPEGWTLDRGKDARPAVGVLKPTAEEAAQTYYAKEPTPTTKMFGGGPETADVINQTVRLATPGLEIGRSVKQGIQSLVLPTAKSPEHLKAAEVLGAQLGSKNRDSKIQYTTLKRDRRRFDKLGVHNPDMPIEDNIGVALMSDLSMGRAIDPRFQEYATKRGRLYDKLLKDLADADVSLQTVRENYFPGMWQKKSIKAFHTAMEEARTAGLGEGATTVNNWSTSEKTWVRNRVNELLESGNYGEDTSALSYLTRKPLEGPEGFRKAKSFEDIMTGVEFGLRPTSNNPVDLDLLKMEEMNRSLMANRAFKEYRASGNEKEITATEPVPEGWKKVDDKYGTIWGGTSVPVWKVLQELAKSAKKDLYFAKFGKEVFADPALKEEINNFPDIHKRKVGQGKSYSQVLMEMLLENPTDFQEKAPGIYAKLQEIADNNPKLKEILGTPEFTNLRQKLPVGGKIIKGYHIFREPVADIFNNYLSSSLYNNQHIGLIYRGWMAMGNLLNQVQLGLGSMFHVGATAAISQVNAGANIIKDIYGLAKGNRSIGDLGDTLKKYPLAMIRPTWEGGKVLREWESPQMDVPTNVPVGQLPSTNEHRIAQIAKAVELAGGSFDFERGLRTRQSDKMIRDWYSGAIGRGKAILRSPIAFTEASMWPTMTFWVPRVKAMTMGDFVGRIIEMNPDKTIEELRPQFRQAWNRNDARAGQVQYNRLFMHNAAKNTVQGLIRAPGWTGGTLAEVGGSPKDAAKFVNEWIKTGKAPENIPDRVAFTLSLLGTAALVNGLMTYAFTGEMPHGMDWWAFRDGGKDDRGNPTRMVLPTYMKDIWAWWRSPGHTLVAKLHPLASLSGEMLRNRDYNNNMIYDEEKGIWNKDSIIRLGEHYIQAYNPFWLRGMSEITEREGGLKETIATHPGKLIAPEFGIMPATRAYTLTSLDEVINRYNKVQITRTPEKAEETNLRRKSQSLIRQGKQDKANEILLEAVKSKKVDLAKAIQWSEDAQELSKVVQFKRLPLDWQAKALLRATPEEEKMLLPSLLDKLGNSEDEDIEKAAPLLKQFYEQRELKRMQLRQMQEGGQEP